MLHRVISFKQKAWMRPYSRLDTEQRKQVQNDFEKDFLQLMSKAVFGQIIECFKDRVELRLTTDNDRAVKWFSQLGFMEKAGYTWLRCEYFSYGKPLYVGTIVLEM